MRYVIKYPRIITGDVDYRIKTPGNRAGGNAMQVVRKTAPVRDTVLFQRATHSYQVRTIGCLSRLHLDKELINGNCSLD